MSRKQDNDEAAAQRRGDPFEDLNGLKLSQDYAGQLNVRKGILSVPVKKPDRASYVMTHPDPSFRISTGVIELKIEREVYLVARELWSALAGESTFSARALFTTMNRQGVLFLWPLRLPRPDGRIDEWSRTALEAAEIATKKWIRVVSNMHLGAYEIFEASADIPPPVWPDMTFNEILRLAFRDRFIESGDHPVLRSLRGEV